MCICVCIVFCLTASLSLFYSAHAFVSLFLCRFAPCSWISWSSTRPWRRGSWSTNTLSSSRGWDSNAALSSSPSLPQHTTLLLLRHLHTALKETSWGFSYAAKSDQNTSCTVHMKVKKLDEKTLKNVSSAFKNIAMSGLNIQNWFHYFTLHRHHCVFLKTWRKHCCYVAVYVTS